MVTKNLSKLRLLSFSFIFTFYLIDMLTTFLALRRGATESNPILHMIFSYGTMSYVLTLVFIVVTIMLAFFIAEMIVFMLERVLYKDKVLPYYISYSIITMVFLILELAAIVNNILIIILA